VSLESILGPVTALCLSIHAGYGCRHSGACCSQWTVPAEAHVVEFVRARGVRTADSASQPFVEGGEGETTTRIAHGQRGTCVFRVDDRCSIHAAGGADALPVACRHYPRVVLRDARGTLISFSHYCPTAAAMLFAGVDPRIIDTPDRLGIAEPIEGLDARDALPPLLRPDMLMDIDGYAAWEGSVIRTLAKAHDAGRALAVVADATERVRFWSPSARTLREAVADAFDKADESARIAHAPLPAELERGVLNYLAARTFGNWVAYQGRGLRTIVAWLHACHDVLRAFIEDEPEPSRETVTNAIRSTDLLMLHTIDSQAFADAVISLER
jgi:hypothetical protein